MCCSPFFCGRSKCMDDCLPPGGATMQSPRYVISCVTMVMKPAWTQKSMMSPGCEYLARLVPNCTTLLCAICHLDSRGAEVKYNLVQWLRKRGEIYTVTWTPFYCDNKDVYSTFVSSTDIILSLASLTFSLFPHTLMWGSAGNFRKKKKEKGTH